MQGREKEAVVMSLVRSNDKVSRNAPYCALAANNRPKREVGFLKDERRLNGMKMRDALSSFRSLIRFLSGYDSRTTTSREQEYLLNSRYSIEI
jgi:hypothetical protein